MNVLLVNTRGHGVARALESRADLFIDVITTGEFEKEYPYARSVEVVTSVEDFTQVRDAALRIWRRNRFERVLSPSELSIPVGGYLRSMFGIDGMSYDVANRFANKIAMKRQLESEGIPIAPWNTITSFDDLPETGERLGWPQVVKRAFGAGAEDVFVVRDAIHAENLRDSPETERIRSVPYPLLTEQYVGISAEYHCDGIVLNGQVTSAFVAKYLQPVLEGLKSLLGSRSLSTNHPKVGAIRRLHQQAVSALGMDSGITHLEVLETTSGALMIGEIAARPGGNGIPAMWRHEYGVDLFHEYVSVLIDGLVSEHPTERHGCHAEVLVSGPPGLVTSVPGPEELNKVSGICEAIWHVSPGDMLSKAENSFNPAGVVILAADDELTLSERVAETVKEITVQVEGQ